MMGWAGWLAVWMAAPFATETARGPIKVSVLVLHKDRVPARVASALERDLLLALRTNPRLKVRSVETLLSQFAAVRPPAALHQARRLLRVGEARLAGRRPWLAVAPLITATTLFERHLAHVKKRTLARAQFLLARAYMAARQWRAADATLLKLFGWRPSFKTLRSYCPPPCIRRVIRARIRVRKLGTGRLSLTSSPPQAKVYLDGGYVGVTPIILLPKQGTHYVTIGKSGYHKKVTPVVIGPGKARNVHLTLRKGKRALILEQAIPRIRKTAGLPRASAAVRELKTFLLLDQIVLVSIRRVGGGRYRATLHLYDLRTDLLLSGLTKKFEDSDARRTARWVRLLYASVHYDGSLADPGEEGDRHAGGGVKGPTPWYKKWWFWTTVGVIVVGVVVPLGYGLSTRNRGGPITPPGLQPVTVEF